jgi:hypothetical protein
LSQLDLTWAKTMFDNVHESRETLRNAQQALDRTFLNDEEVVEPAILERAKLALEPAILERDLARHSHINLLADTLAQYESRCTAERLDASRTEADRIDTELIALPSVAYAVGSALTKRLRQEELYGPADTATESAAAGGTPLGLLPQMAGWEREAVQLRAELEDLRPYGVGVPPSTDELPRLHEAWEMAKDDLSDAKHDEQKIQRNRRATPEERVRSEEKVQDARRLVQTAERELRKERVRLAAVASAHFPELFVMEPILSLGGADDGMAVQSLKVERELDHDCDPGGDLIKSARLNEANSRHRVYRCSRQNNHQTL